MAEIKRISDRITYIEASDNPLSADVICVRGNLFMWLYDVGNGDESFLACSEHLKENDLPLNVVLSHFHPDHIGNLSRYTYKNLYVGANTYKYTGCGSIVDSVTSFEAEGITLIPFPSSHAKGSLALEMGDYILLGDALYSTQKSGKICYNANLLREAVKILETSKATTLLLSHKAGLCMDKDLKINELKEILTGVSKNDAYIYL